jgi:hypothetical protein
MVPHEVSTVFSLVRKAVKKILPPIFFLRKCNYSYNEIYIYRGYILHKVEIIFPQSLLHYEHSLHDTLYAGGVKLC